MSRVKNQAINSLTVYVYQPNKEATRWLQGGKRMLSPVRNRDYAIIYNLMKKSIHVHPDKSYTIIEEEAKKNMPEILKSLRNLKGATRMSQTSKNALTVALRTLEFPGNELSTQVSNVFFFMSVWSFHK